MALLFNTYEVDGHPLHYYYAAGVPNLFVEWVNTIKYHLSMGYLPGVMLLSLLSRLDVVIVVPVHFLVTVLYLVFERKKPIYFATMKDQ